MAKGCLVFMESEGVCKRWFMHDVMHKWEKGCEYQNCKYKHARPTTRTTPKEAPAAATAKFSATTTRALPSEPTLTDLMALKDANKPPKVDAQTSSAVTAVQNTG